MKTSNGKNNYEINYIKRNLKLLIRREGEKAREALDLAKRCSAHRQHASRTLSAFRKLVRSNNFLCALMCAVVITCASAPVGAHADNRKCKRDRDNKNYILRRQQAYEVEGTPTSRLIIGKREIDIYRDGKAFEKDARVR